MIVVSHCFNPFWKRSSASSVWDWGHSAFAFGLDWNQLMPTYYVPHTNSSSEPNEFLDTPSDDIGPTRSVNLKSIVTVHANQRSYYMFLLGCNSHTHALLLSNVIHFFSQKKTSYLVSHPNNTSCNTRVLFCITISSHNKRKQTTKI